MTNLNASIVELEEDDSWMLEVMGLELAEALDDGSPAYLYQVSENAWTAEAIESPLSTWVCIDQWAGVYELQGNPMTCEPRSFIRTGEFWDMDYPIGRSEWNG